MQGNLSWSFGFSLLTLVLIAGLLALFGCAQAQIHNHADFAVFINGQEFDFNQARFMTSDELCNSPNPQVPESIVHLHDGIGTVVHVHWHGVTWSDFFKSIGGDLNADCLVFDGNKYCNNAEKSLEVFIDGKQAIAGSDAQIADLDKVLVSYGDRGRNIQPELNSITDLSRFEDKGPDC